MNARADGILPSDTRAVAVTLQTQRASTSGDCDGFADNISLILTTIWKEGDLSGDLAVGSADLDIVRANWGLSVIPGDLLSGDADGDGVIGSGDLDLIRAHWGEEKLAAVPEPGVWTLLLGVLGSLISRRRR